MFFPLGTFTLGSGMKINHKMSKYLPPFFNFIFAVYNPDTTQTELLLLFPELWVFFEENTFF